MAERNIIKFSFICEPRRVEEAQDLLIEMNTTAFVFVGKDREARFVIGEEEVPVGVEISGYTIRGGKGRIIDSLAERRIAGFNHANMIFFPRETKD